MSKHGCRLLRLSLDINVRSRRRLCRCGRRRRPHKFVAISCFVISYRASSVTPRTSTPERPIVLPPPSWPRRALMPLLNSPNHFLASLSAQDSELLYPHLKSEQFPQGNVLYGAEDDLLPNLPSFMRRVCSGYALVWGV